MRCGFALCLMALVVAAVGCHAPLRHGMPPAERMLQQGPGVGGPGPGVMMYQQAAGASAADSQVAFVRPEGMVVTWDVSMAGQFDSVPMVAPGRQNFPQGAIYRLKLTNIPGYDGVELYPTLEVGPAMPRTQAFLAHNAIPIELTASDFEQVLAGNFVTKVIYLPDPEYQELALAGVETLVSTRLDPGVDPIVEADRRGSILGVLRLGNKDLEIPGQAAEGASVVPTSYVPYPGGAMAPGMGAPMTSGNRSTVPTNYISGVTGPQYGMPISGTPIGLPGPPHIPLGSPAGLQKHVIRNYTPLHVPGPTKEVKVHARRVPGLSYSKPDNTAWIVDGATPGSVCGQQVCGDPACQTCP